MSIAMSPADWLLMLGHFVSLSLMAVGGAITTAPEMHRYLVFEQRWLSEGQFTSSIALAQAAPGPNALYIALLGWNIGMNAGAGQGLAMPGSLGLALAGMLVAMLGTLLPSCTLTYLVAQWGQRNRELRPVRAFKAGMAPLVIALLISTGWLLTAAHDQPAHDWPLWLLTAVSALLVWRTKVHMLWLLGAGALMGAMGWLG